MILREDAARDKMSKSISNDYVKGDEDDLCALDADPFRPSPEYLLIS